MKLSVLCFFLACVLLACNQSTETANASTAGTDTLESKRITLEPVMLSGEESPNPAAPGFDAANSNPQAIKIADSIVHFHGGRAAYDAVNYLRWNFFGARTLHWDKQNSRVRIEVPQKNMVYLLDYSTTPLSGKVRKLGDEIVQPDTLAKYLQEANSMFINDSYWLVQQFKLKDAGVTLKLVEEVRLDPQAKRPSYVIDQTFAGVGDTPGNRYRLFVDKVSFRINTWQFFRNAADTEPAIETPWKGYLPHQGILLSGDRSGRFQLTDISASKDIPDRIFDDF
ncbi:hypothetical protein QWY85_00085 [Neolewinella lacunae]|uniref:DUF4292 domain-containing protein n=1 Tax=Neolewinella lacunae TaxID=1517758 RepID=A0A923TDY2_9BACT|nr:hypothetical protein [Neolewinella lacunae]MBC6995322.1 hypothetical protein [Neolewinella lacunae]MDN3633034.1 hypothetical protein [Neolewinella lacunae]